MEQEIDGEKIEDKDQPAFQTYVISVWKLGQKVREMKSWGEDIIILQSSESYPGGNEQKR